MFQVTPPTNHVLNRFTVRPRYKKQTLLLAGYLAALSIPSSHKQIVEVAESEL